ncbi:MAG: ABC transporter substrate-binding protein [Eubacteriales bacterium]|nr:ABC transporter substrate-binding protein [Eubacteriales bacterium]
MQEQQSESQTSDEVGEAISFEDLKIERSMELQYANQFQVDYYESGYALITIEDSGSFLMIPKGMQTPQNVPEQITILKQPENIYLLSTSVMDLFRAIDGLDCIKLTGTKESDWYIEEARAAMESGDMVYAGKYNAPDYELILSKKCDLALENTMILHNPEVKEQLEHLGIPVIIERSSYEGHPLGRMEWVKLYGVLLGKEQEAEAFFDEQLAHLNETIANEEEKNDVTGGEKKTVAFFYITSNGAVNVRKSGDYVSKMIDMAGGEYVFRDLVDEEENALSTMRIQMEAFYAGAKDADYLIYNSTIDGEIKNLDMLIQKSELLKDFKAVKNGNVWCTEKSMFQESTGIAEFIVDMHRMMYEENPEDLQYMFQLK